MKISRLIWILLFSLLTASCKYIEHCPTYKGSNVHCQRTKMKVMANQKNAKRVYTKIWRNF